MNLKQIRSIVKRNTKADTHNMPDYSVNQMIDLAQKEIVRQTLCLKKKADVTTVATQQEYDLPSDFHKSSEMKIGSIFLQYQIEEYIDRLFTTDAETGTPYYYYIDREAGKYGLYPIPSGVYTGNLTYRAIPTTMSLDADTPDIPELYHEAIVMGASYRVAEQLNDMEMKMHYYSMFKAYMTEIANDMGARQAESFPVQVTSKDILDA